MSNNHIQFSLILFWCFMVSQAVSQAVPKDPNQIDERIEVFIYDFNIIIERLFEGMWSILPYVFRSVNCPHFSLTILCRCAASPVACIMCTVWFSYSSCMSSCTIVLVSQCGRMLGASVSTALSEIDISDFLHF